MVKEMKRLDRQKKELKLDSATCLTGTSNLSLSRENNTPEIQKIDHRLSFDFNWKT